MSTPAAGAGCVRLSSWSPSWSQRRSCPSALGSPSASFLDTATASSGWSASTETLQPPSGLTSTGCLLGTVTLTWSASPTTWATGYEVRWSTTSGGPYDRGPLTTTLLTGSVTGLSALTTYYFVVRATRGAWFSADSNQHSASCFV